MAENREANNWHQSINSVLESIVGRPVESSDMFRIGKFHQGKVCPIIVKLHNQWDKRLILSKRSSLKTSICKVFLLFQMNLSMCVVRFVLTG